MNRIPKSGGVLVLSRVEIVVNRSLDGVPVGIKNPGIIEEDFANISDVTSGSLADAGSCSFIDVNGLFAVSRKGSKLLHV